MSLKGTTVVEEVPGRRAGPAHVGPAPLCVAPSS